jgi:sterol desaturase/sphingolipid hydroxylase (fatty acid hydroxylase superfamily)
MQLVFSRFGYILCITSIVGASIFLIEFALYSELQVLFFAALGSIFFTVLGEFFIPLFKDWKPNFKENFLPDVSLFVLNYILLQSQLLQIFIASIAINFSGGGFNLWPSDSNIVFQLVLALVISEFGLYWFHRGCHEIPFLWRFHKIHHNPERLYWFNATRFHYLDVTLLQVSAALPLLLLGAEGKIIALVTIFSTVHGYWQHINAEQDQGLLNYFFSGPELHRWHHNLNPDIANHNYGNNLIVWDHIFKTFYWPKDNKEQLKNIGVQGDTSNNVISMTFDPFRR